MVATPNYGLSTDITLGGNSPSDVISPSEKAIKTYVDNHAGGGSLEDLSDVSVGTATSGQVLGYNGTNWVNTNKTLVVMRDWSVS